MGIIAWIVLGLAAGLLASIRPTPSCPLGSVLPTRRTWKWSTSVL
jgi:uncharacterized membrane protein YeaQ/YmgE (transglycosylase-associated protein family)